MSGLRGELDEVRRLLQLRNLQLTDLRADKKKLTRNQRPLPPPQSLTWVLIVTASGCFIRKLFQHGTVTWRQGSSVAQKLPTDNFTLFVIFVPRQNCTQGEKIFQHYSTKWEGGKYFYSIYHVNKSKNRLNPKEKILGIITSPSKQPSHEILGY